MFIKILFGLIIILAIFSFVVILQPSNFRITRSTTFAASPDIIFAQINDLHHWQAWSPWAKLDPNSKISFDGPPTGTGASFAWSGNNEIGEGRMTVMESNPSRLVKFRLEFMRPFIATNTSEFTIMPEASQTKLTWSMYGQNRFMAKAVGLFMNCDKMVGDQFEQGFSNLRSIVESPPSTE